MQLPGRLCATTLGDLLGALHRGRATGVLELVETAGVMAGRRHQVHLAAGLVEQVDTPLPVARVGDILRREGFIGDDGVRLLVRRLVQEPAKRAGQLLVEARQATRAQVGAALRHQLRTRLDAVFGIVDARIHFHVARPRRQGEGAPLPLSPHEFLHGRERSRDVRDREAAHVRARGRRPAVERIDRRRNALRVLGLSETADQKTVQRAFRSLARKLHPDSHPGASRQELAVLMRGFSELTAAYHELVA